jgi:hypothetical protein
MSGVLPKLSGWRIIRRMLLFFSSLKTLQTLKYTAKPLPRKFGVIRAEMWIYLLPEWELAVQLRRWSGFEKV